MSIEHTNGQGPDFHLDNTQQPLRAVLDAVDATDVSHQTDLYRQVLQVEFLNSCDQLRHRADMMRRRADEFDKIADTMEHACADAIRHAGFIHGHFENALQLLADHAHIQPTNTR